MPEHQVRRKPGPKPLFADGVRFECRVSARVLQKLEMMAAARELAPGQLLGELVELAEVRGVAR